MFEEGVHGVSRQDAAAVRRNGILIKCAFGRILSEKFRKDRMDEDDGMKTEAISAIRF
jgi:hypothetical protein